MINRCIAALQHSVKYDIRNLRGVKNWYIKKLNWTPLEKHRTIIKRLDSAPFSFSTDQPRNMSGLLLQNLICLYNLPKVPRKVSTDQDQDSRRSWPWVSVTVWWNLMLCQGKVLVTDRRVIRPEDIYTPCLAMARPTHRKSVCIPSCSC